MDYMLMNVVETIQRCHPDFTVSIMGFEKVSAGRDNTKKLSQWLILFKTSLNGFE